MVKEKDLKSFGLCPRRFESCSCRYLFFSIWLRIVATLICGMGKKRITKASSARRKIRYSIPTLLKLRNVQSRVRFRENFTDFIAQCLTKNHRKRSERYTTGIPWDPNEDWSFPASTPIMTFNGQSYLLIPVSSVPNNAVPLPVRVILPAGGDESKKFQEPEISPKSPELSSTTNENTPAVDEETDDSSYESSSVQIEILIGPNT